MTTSNQITPTAHSYSRMSTYSACPLSYRLSVIDKVGTDDSDALEIGSAAHEFFEHWVKGFKDKSDPTIVSESILSLAAKCFQKEPRDQANFKEYLEICETFARSYSPEPEYPVVLAEMQVAFDRNWKKCDWFAKSVMFRVKIDRIDMPDVPADKLTKIRIEDYKTGWAGAMDGFQLDIYALAAALLWPTLEQIEVSFYYVKSGFRQTKLLEVKDLDVTKVQLEALMMRMENDTRWKAKPGARCLNCGVASFCDQKPSDLVAITKIDQAQTLGAEIAFLDAQAKAKKKSLKAWCEKEGPVTTGGLVYSNWPKESYKVEIAPLLSLCVQHSVDPAIVLNSDTTALKKLFRQNLAFAEAVAPYSSVDVSTSFGARKAEKED